MLPVYIPIREKDGQVVYKKAEVQEGETTELPGLCYILAKNGAMLYQDNDLACSIVPILPKDPNIIEIKTSASSAYPKVKYRQYLMVLEFFRNVHEKFKSEAMVLLSIDTKHISKGYKIHIPKQIVSSGGIKYDCADIYNHLAENEKICGSIHSHPNFSASQSSIDSADEEDIIAEGIHITIGNIDQAVPSIHTRLVMCGKSFIPKDNKVETTPQSRKITVPPEWLGKVTEKTTTVVKGYNKDWHGGWYTNPRSGGSVIQDNTAVLGGDEIAAWSLLLALPLPNEKTPKIVQSVDWEHLRQFAGGTL